MLLKFPPSEGVHLFFTCPPLPVRPPPPECFTLFSRVLVLVAAVVNILITVPGLGSPAVFAAIAPAVSTTVPVAVITPLLIALRAQAPYTFNSIFCSSASL